MVKLENQLRNLHASSFGLISLIRLINESINSKRILFGYDEDGI